MYTFAIICQHWDDKGSSNPSSGKIRTFYHKYRKISNISHTFVGNYIVDYSDVVGALPVAAAPTTSSFSTKHMAPIGWATTTARRDEKHLSFDIQGVLY